MPEQKERGGPSADGIPSRDEICGWVEELWGIGNKDRYGYRMPGTEADHEAADWVLQKFREFGLGDTFSQKVAVPVCFPDQWSLNIITKDWEREIPCYFLRYAAFTPPEGITAPIVYVGKGSEDDFKAADVAGKIVAVSWSSDPNIRDEARTLLRREHAEPIYTYNPDKTVEAAPGGEPVFEGSAVNRVSSYRLAVKYGAAGYIGILDYLVGKVNQWLHVDFAGVDLEIPSLTVSPEAGDSIRQLLKSGPAQARMVLTGYSGIGETYDIYGFLEGKSEELIAVHTHHDGWATNDASGMSVVLALAKYFGRFPRESREKTMMFVAFGSHFGRRPHWTKHDCKAYDLLPKTVCTNQVEHISKDYKKVDGKIVESGLVGRRRWTLTGPQPGPGGSVNPHLLAFVTEAIEKHGIVRSSISPRWTLVEPSSEWVIATKATHYAEAGIPTIRYTGGLTPWGMTSMDTPDTVMSGALRPLTAAFIDIIRQQDAVAAEKLLPAGKTE